MEEETTRKPGIRLFRTEPLRRPALHCRCLLCSCPGAVTATLQSAPKPPLPLQRLFGFPASVNISFSPPTPSQFFSSQDCVTSSTFCTRLVRHMGPLLCSGGGGGGVTWFWECWSCSWFLPANIIILIFKQGTWYKTGLWYNGIMHSDSMVPIVVPWHQFVVGQTEGPWYNGIVPRQK